MSTMAEDPILWAAVVDAAALVLDGTAKATRVPSMTTLMPKVAETRSSDGNLIVRFVDGSERSMATFE